MEEFKIFVVEDDPWYSNFLKHLLSANPEFRVECFMSGNDCLSNMYKNPGIITVDYNIPDMTGHDLLKKILKTNPETGVIIISGQEDITVAIDLLKDGAFDYIVKDENTRNRLWKSIHMLKQNLHLKSENEKLKIEVGKKYTFSDEIIGSSSGMLETFRLASKAASSQITVSITGETGTGKEMIAKSIHYNSARSKMPFIGINVSAVPKELIESEFFGHEKGAFSGAHARKPGVFENASKGTLFLDEIAEMDMGMQTKLLRVLQEREVMRVGGSQLIPIDVRLITATHKNLAAEVDKGTFRADLYYRLMGLKINLVPLRERGNDIMVLAKHFADAYCKENTYPKVVFTKDAVDKLMNYPYPGNVRELKAIVELAIILTDNDKISAEHLSFSGTTTDTFYKEDETSLDHHIRKIISQYLSKYDNNLMLVAKKLEISRSTIYRYIKNFDINT
jgi:DNA-binding NtrC family response regulator